MKRFCSSLFFLLIAFPAWISAEKVVWKGKVKADGTPTEAVSLNLGKKYQIQVSGTMNLGKWRTQGEPLNEDACFEFLQDSKNEIPPIKQIALRNSMGIEACDGKYRPDHIYQSKPFTAEQNLIHFWIHDIDYSDNSGSLDIQIAEL